MTATTPKIVVQVIGTWRPDRTGNAPASWMCRTHALSQNTSWQHWNLLVPIVAEPEVLPLLREQDALRRRKPLNHRIFMGHDLILDFVVLFLDFCCFSCFVAGAVLCGPCKAHFVAGAGLCGPWSADFVAGARLCGP